MSLHGKSAIVTGAASGIGKATAILLASCGARVGLCDITDAGGQATARAIEQDGGSALYFAADVANEDAVKQFVSKVTDVYGPSEILVNNAGVGGSGARLPELSTLEWQRILDVNLNGAFYCCKYVLPGMLSAGRGAIVNTSSVLAVSTLAGHLPYTTAKSALIGFTKVLAHELGPRGVRVNCILPGPTDTAMMWRGLSPDERPAAEAEVVAAQPLRRLARPEEIARAALFLASDDASFITGATLVVDGGLLTRSPGPR